MRTNHTNISIEIVEVEDQRSRAKPLGEPKSIVAGLKAIEL